MPTINPDHFNTSEWEEMYNASGEAADLLKEELHVKAAPVEVSAEDLKQLILCCQDKANDVQDDPAWVADLNSAIERLTTYLDGDEKKLWLRVTRADTALRQLQQIADYITPGDFPGLAKKIRSAIKSAEGALRNAQRFTEATR
jgi:hypothetical protein